MIVLSTWNDGWVQRTKKTMWGLWLGTSWPIYTSFGTSELACNLCINMQIHRFFLVGARYVAEEAHDIEITRKGKLKQFENVLAQGCTLSPQTVRVFDFQDGAL